MHTLQKKYTSLQAKVNDFLAILSSCYCPLWAFGENAQMGLDDIKDYLDKHCTTYDDIVDFVNTYI